MKLKTRILMIVLVALSGMLILGMTGMLQLRDSLFEERHEQIALHLKYAKAQLEYFHALETSGKMSRSEAQQRALESISAQRVGDNYIFVRTLADDILLAHPNASRIGKADLALA